MNALATVTPQRGQIVRARDDFNRALAMWEEGLPATAAEEIRAIAERIERSVKRGGQ